MDNPSSSWQTRLEALENLLFQTRQGAANQASKAATLIPQPASLQGTLLIDPQNLSGVASDKSPPTATFAGFTGPIYRTWAGLVAAWGTYAPLLTLNTTVVFVSSHTDNTDPVYFRPLIARGANVTIQGSAPTVIATGVVLSGTVAKSRTAGSNSLLQTTLGASGAAGQLVQDTTHPSRAWSYKSLGANAFSMSQPMALQAIAGTVAPAEVDTWTNGDSVNLLSPIAVNIAHIEPQIIDNFGTFDTLGLMTLYQLTGFNPGGTDTSVMTLNALNGSITLQECGFNRDTFGTTGGNCQIQIANCSFAIMTYLGNVVVNGGIIAGMGSGSSLNAAFDGDVILGGSFCNLTSGVSIFGLVYLDVNVTAETGMLIVQNVNYGAHVLYGSGTNTIKLNGNSRCYLNGGTFTGGFTAPGLVTGIQLNGAATGSSHTGAQPDVLNAGISTTPTHLDAVAGAAGFGGTAFNLGGASVSNLA